MEKVYYDPKTGYTGANILCTRVKLPRHTVVKWLETQPAYTVHKPSKKKYARNKVIVSRIDEQWAIDLADLQSLKKQNNGYTFLLNCIDVFSKYAWSVPIKNKSADAIVNAFRSILEGGRKPEKVQSDAGTEFTNKKFQTFLQQNDIEFFTINSELKASVVERFNRTLKERMWRYFTKHNTYKYIDVLENLLIGYNNTKHRTIGIEPVNVNSKNEREILQKAFKIDTSDIKFKFDISDKVRISKVKGVFEKGYEPNWSEETFIVDKRLKRKPPVYVLKDTMGEKLEGVFYEPEMQKVELIDNVYIIEKIIKTRKKRGKTEYFVKWRGYPDKFDSWVNHIVKI